MVEQNNVEIRVRGWIGQRWVSWFEGMDMVYEGYDGDPPTTVLTGSLVDQAALRGLLTRIWDLNLTLLSVTWADAMRGSEGGNESE
jgi:hypothetical protein